LFAFNVVSVTQTLCFYFFLHFVKTKTAQKNRLRIVSYCELHFQNNWNNIHKRTIKYVYKIHHENG